MNTRKGTVKGIVQGEESRTLEMKTWLETKGSPKARIDRLEHKITQIDGICFQRFDVKKTR